MRRLTLLKPESKLNSSDEGTTTARACMAKPAIVTGFQMYDPNSPQFTRTSPWLFTCECGGKREGAEAALMWGQRENNMRVWANIMCHAE